MGSLKTAAPNKSISEVFALRYDYEESPDHWSSALRCSICCEFYRTPVTLRCGHSFCKGCISEWMQKCRQAMGCRQKPRHARYIPCPNCRAQHSEPEIISNPVSNHAAAACIDGWLASTERFSWLNNPRTVDTITSVKGTQTVKIPRAKTSNYGTQTQIVRYADASTDAVTEPEKPELVSRGSDAVKEEVTEADTQTPTITGTVIETQTEPAPVIEQIPRSIQTDPVIVLPTPTAEVAVQTCASISEARGWKNIPLKKTSSIETDPQDTDIIEELFSQNLRQLFKEGIGFVLFCCVVMAGFHDVAVASGETAASWTCYTLAFLLPLAGVFLLSYPALIMAAVCGCFDTVIGVCLLGQSFYTLHYLSVDSVGQLNSQSQEQHAVVGF